MASLPSRKTLDEMKRVDLQKLCKDYGVRANLKSEALIDLLMETQSAPAPAPEPTRRSASTRQSKNRAGPSRINSLIIHDINDDEKDERTEKDMTEALPEDRRAPSEPTVPATRLRKGKELQRLGVGRPVAAGGAGPRAVTKSVNVTKGRRGRMSKTLAPREATIEEEPELPEISPSLTQTVVKSDLDFQLECQSKVATHVSPLLPSSPEYLYVIHEIEKRVAQAIRPFHEQMNTMRLELEQMLALLKADILLLKSEFSPIAELQDKVNNLAARIEYFQTRKVDKQSTQTLQEDVVMDSSPALSASNQNTPIVKKFGPSSRRHAKTGASDSTSINVGQEPEAHAEFAEVPASLLGKRHRDSAASNLPDVDERRRDETDLSPSLNRPFKKRAKLMEDDPAASDDKEALATNYRPTTPDDTAERNDISFTLRLPTFTIFQGLDDTSNEYTDPPPPTNTLPIYYAPPSPTSANHGARLSSRQEQGTTTSTANASENQHPFNFSFLPASSTPNNNGMYMPNFSFPDPPQSPSPAGTSIGGYSTQHHDRNDIFKSFGMPSPVRSRSVSALGVEGGHQQAEGPSSSDFVDPAALTKRASSGKRKESLKTQPTPLIGLVPRQLSTEPDSALTGSPNSTTSQATHKKTMYGTELEGDTRFGDFGIEGVGNTYWSNMY